MTESSDVAWYSATNHYWDAGPGSGGISSGPLSAPDNAAAADGQDSFFASGILTYPSNSFAATNYWVDPEIVTGGASHTATAALTVTPALAAGRARGQHRGGTLAVIPVFSAGRARGRYRGASLIVVPAFTAGRTMAHVRHASLLVEQGAQVAEFD